MSRDEKGNDVEQKESLCDDVAPHIFLSTVAATGVAVYHLWIGKVSCKMISQIMKSKTADPDPAAATALGDPLDVDFRFKKYDLNIEELLSNQFSSFNHVPLASAVNRVDNGSLIIGELCKIFQGRVDMEDKELGYSTRVSRPNLYENEIRLSTSERALGFLKNYYLFLSKEQSSFRRSLDEEVVFQLENYKTIRYTEIMKHKTELDKINEEIKSNEENLAKAKRSLLKTLEEVHYGKEKLVQIERLIEEFLIKMTEEKKKEKEKVIGRFLSAFESNPMADKEKQIKKLDRLENEVNQKVKDIAMKKRILLESLSRKDEVVSKALKSFEMAEKGRLQHTEHSLRKFCQLEREALEARLKLLTAFEEGALTSLDAEADIRLYVSKERNFENTQRSATSLQIMDWDYATRAVRDRKMSVLSDASASHQPSQAVDSPSDPPVPEMPESPVSTAPPASTDAPHPSPTPEELKSDPPSEESDPPIPSPTLEGTAATETTAATAPATATTSEPSDGTTPETHRDERSATLSSTSSLPTKSSLPASHKFVSELIDSHVFCDHSSLKRPSSPAPAPQDPTDISLLGVHEICHRAFADAYGMDLFLQILDEKRGRSAELDRIGFHNMKIAMKIFLDRCSEIHDVKSALRIANMSITFHLKHDNSENNGGTRRADAREEEDGPEEEEEREAESAKDRMKHYIQREEDISQHQLWSQDGFWEDALMIGLKAQLDMMDPVLWDDLDSDLLKEKVLALHNMIFGQLGTLAFTMHEMGMPELDVEKLILSLSEGAQLGEDQQLDLLKSIRATYGNPSLYRERSHSNSSLSSLAKEEEAPLSDHQDDHGDGDEDRKSQTELPEVAQQQEQEQQDQEQEQGQREEKEEKEEEAQGKQEESSRSGS